MFLNQLAFQIKYYKKRKEYIIHMGLFSLYGWWVSYMKQL